MSKEGYVVIFAEIYIYLCLCLLLIYVYFYYEFIMNLCLF